MELLSGFRTLVFDVECYSNYFLVSFQCIETDKIVYFEHTPLGYTINGEYVGFDRWTHCLTFILFRCLVIGFNSKTYDMPMTLVAIQGKTPNELKFVSDEIIIDEMRAYQVERKYGVRAPYINHIDVIDVAPITASLKIYMGRLHCERMQDLPFPPETVLTAEQAAIVRDYNVNDLDGTKRLYLHVLPFIQMREELGQEYRQDWRSKSDAQIAEAVIVTELERLGPIGKKAGFETGDEFFYKVPEWVSFETPQFQHALEVVANTPFTIGGGGSALCPQSIVDLKPRLGSSVYRLGIGGLHSSEESVYYRESETHLIIDRDVASYYPYIILNNNLYPEHLGPAFLEVYRSLVMRRLTLKKAKNPLEAGLKIAINGTFGKLGNFYSDIYSPDLLTQVTMTGQLALLMQIEAAELAGISVISANTDGVVYHCRRDAYDRLENVLTAWEGRTGFVTEETRYSALYSRDVNNYIAVKHLQPGKNKPEIKTKGVYCERGSAQNSVLSKNPEMLVCSEAVQQYLANGVPIEETINSCDDIRKFVSVRNVKGGASKSYDHYWLDDWIPYEGGTWVRRAWMDEGLPYERMAIMMTATDIYPGGKPSPVKIAKPESEVYLGKAVRWYYAKEETGTINYVISGNKVPKSEGAKPLMILPLKIPDDLDRSRYIAEANDILYDLGVRRRPEAATFF